MVNGTYGIDLNILGGLSTGSTGMRTLVDISSFVSNESHSFPSPLRPCSTSARSVDDFVGFLEVSPSSLRGGGEGVVCKVVVDKTGLVVLEPTLLSSSPPPPPPPLLPPV